MELRVTKVGEARFRAGVKGWVQAQRQFEKAFGPERTADDAAGVVGLFNAIDRIADATGIPLEAEKAEASADFRAALGIDRFDVTARL
jgi:hypothetical protein